MQLTTPIVFTLLEKVPFQFLKYGNHTVVFAKYLSCDNPKFRGVWFINLGVLIAETIFKVSDTIDLERAMKFLVFVEDTIQPEQDTQYATGELAYPGVGTFLSKLSESDNMDIVLIKCADYQKPILLDNVSYITLSYTNRYVIRQFIVEYLSLYPEYFYSIIGNTSAPIFNAVMELWKTYEGVWCLLLDVPNISSPDVVPRITQSGWNFNIITTWIDAAINAYEQDFISIIDVIDCANIQLEELQLGLMRREINTATERWEDVIDSLNDLLGVIHVLPDGTEKLVSNVNATTLLRAARENYVALLLSDTGIDMILKLHAWVTEQPPQAGELPQGMDPKDLFVHMSKEDAVVAYQLSRIFPVERVLQRKATKMKLLRTSSGNVTVPAKPATEAKTYSTMPSLSTAQPAYLKGLTTTPYTPTAPQTATPKATKVQSDPIPFAAFVPSVRPKSVRGVTIGGKGKPLPPNPPS